MTENFFSKKQASAACLCPAHKNFLYEFTYDEIITNRENENDEVEIVILLEHKEFAGVTKLFTKFVNYYLKGKKYAIIPALGCTPKGFTSSDTIQTYKKCKQFHIKQRLEKLNPKVIITTGRAIYHITESKEVQYQHFYSLHEDDRWFYSPEYSCRVYPIPALYLFINNRKNENAASILDNYELNFTKEQFSRAIDSLTLPKKRKPILKYINVENTTKFFTDLENNEEIEFVSVDSETTGKNYWKDRIINITIAFNGYEGYFLDFNKIDKQLMNRVLSKKKLIFQNGKFDLKFFRANGILDLQCYFDTMIAGYALNENSKNSLKFFAWVYTEYGGYENELRNYLKALNTRDFSAIPIDILMKYACTDAIITYLIFKYFENRLLEEPEVRKNFYEIMIPGVNMLTEVEMHGIKINQQHLYNYNLKLFNNVEKIDKKLTEYFGKQFNFNSTKQLSEELLKKGVEPLLDDKGKPLVSKTGDLLLNKTTLPMYAKNGNEAAQLLIDRNHYAKEISQLSLKQYYKDNIENLNQPKQKNIFDIFAINIVDEENEENEIKNEDYDPIDDFDIDEISTTVNRGLLSSVYNGRLFGEFSVSGTETGRLSSSGGLVGTVNLQNFPKTLDFRKLFMPEDGFIFAEVDYVAMEVSILSQISGPGPLEKVILQGIDPHCYTGVAIYNATYNKTMTYEEFFSLAKIQEVKEFKEFRNLGKTCNFQFAYGATEFGIAQYLSIPVDKGKMLLETYRATYPEVAKYMETYRDNAKKYGYVDTLLGKRKRFPQLMYIGKDTKLHDINNMLNGAINAPIQGTSGQSTYTSMVHIHKEFKKNKMKSRVLANVHDSILFELHLNEKSEAMDIITKWMTYQFYENFNGNTVKLSVDPKISSIWGFDDEA